LTCEQNFLRTTTRDDNGRYVVSLLFRVPEYVNSAIGHSTSSALSQFLRTEQRLKRDSQLKTKYDSVIQEYLDLQRIREVPPTHNSASYYLPHHAVLRPGSMTTNLRVVFNVSNPSANGISLNDIPYAGPVLQSDLTIQILKPISTLATASGTFEIIFASQTMLLPRLEPMWRLCRQKISWIVFPS